MLKLEQLHKNAAVSGIEPNEAVRIVSTETAGPDAVTVYYKASDGRLGERMLFRADEDKLSLADGGRPWAFDAPGDEFKLATEACRLYTLCERKGWAEEARAYNEVITSWPGIEAAPQETGVLGSQARLDI